jgi:hypothetical protein
LPYSNPPVFEAGQIDVSSRLNAMRANDGQRADGSELVGGDDHGHLLVDEGTISSMSSDTWYAVSFSLSFRKPPAVFLFIADSLNPGRWVFQTTNISTARYLSQARDIGTTGCDVRAYMLSGSFSGATGRWIAIGV